MKKYYRFSESGIYAGEFLSDMPTAPDKCTDISPDNNRWQKKFDGSKWIEYQPVEESWLITKFAFKNRFPREKWKAARALIPVDADIADFFEDIEFAKFIDLRYQPLVDSINSFGLPTVPENIRLSEEEIAAILNVPCQPGEEV